MDHRDSECGGHKSGAKWGVSLERGPHKHTQTIRISTQAADGESDPEVDANRQTRGQDLAE